MTVWTDNPWVYQKQILWSQLRSGPVLCSNYWQVSSVLLALWKQRCLGFLLLLCCFRESAFFSTVQVSAMQRRNFKDHCYFCISVTLFSIQVFSYQVTDPEIATYLSSRNRCLTSTTLASRDIHEVDLPFDHVTSRDTDFLVGHQRDLRCLRVASSSWSLKLMSHYNRWSNCRPTTSISRL